MKIGARSRKSFVLLEAMLGVTIFVVGVLALGNAVNNCLNTEIARAEDQRARLALENRMAEIEAGAVSADPRAEKLEGMFAGITLKQTRTPLNVKNERNEPLPNLFTITLEASWQAGSQPEAKAITFHVFKAQ